MSSPEPTRFCTGPTRREALAVGSLGLAGLTLPNLLAAREAEPPKRPRACIMLFLLGAPPQQETWDPKPDSPAEARGDLGVIQTATPGLLIGETMTQTSRHTNKIAILRAVQTNDNAHSASGYFMTTGVAHQPMQVENAKPGAPNDWPSLGAIVRRVFEGRADREIGQNMTTGVPHAPMQVENAKPGAPNDWLSMGAIVRKVFQPGCKLPAAVTLPEQSANDNNFTWPGQDAGFLGRAADPWLINCEPEKGKFDIPGLALPTDVTRERFDDRRRLLDAFASRSLIPDPHTDRAFAMISSPAARKAFDLDSEGVKTRDRYGRSRFGQSCLLARRLVEAGVPLIRVNWTRVPNMPNNGHWDTHTKNTEALRKMMPILDTAYTALLEDLTDRGLLDDTLVVWCAEFGRTPKINGAGGRDHWGPCFSVALAGGGVRGGAVYGSSDKLAAYPKDGRVTPQDLHATIYHCLGIPRDTEIHDGLGRPLAICRGEPVRAILGRDVTEEEWEHGYDYLGMIRFLSGRASDRKLRLFAVEICRASPIFRKFPASDRWLEIIRLHAEGIASDAELREVAVEAEDQAWRYSAVGPETVLPEIGTPEWDEFDREHHALCAVGWLAAGATATQTFASAVADAIGELDLSPIPLSLWTEIDLLHEIFGNPFRPVAFDPAWRTSTATALARQMYESRDFSAMPILADALHDAGCDSDDILNHCRGPGQHVRGCWVVDLVLGKS